MDYYLLKQYIFCKGCHFYDTYHLTGIPLWLCNYMVPSYRDFHWLLFNAWMDDACHIFVARVAFLYSTSIRDLMQVEWLRKVLICQVKEALWDVFNNIFIKWSINQITLHFLFRTGVFRAFSLSDLAATNIFWLDEFFKSLSLIDCGKVSVIWGRWFENV